MVRKATLAALAFTFSQPAAADEPLSFQTGNDVLRTCSAERGSFVSGLCFGFIEGALRRDDLARWMDPKSAYACELPGVEKGQIFEVVITYLKNHPEKRHMYGASLVLVSVQEAFCKK